ncbi:hypothetical protein ADL04_30860 [Streptomyces sp. NRRL B-3648]|nr:hypothetical protein ADL04_30860 [Streptomyces sp. NRRL B-3648]
MMEAGVWPAFAQLVRTLSGKTVEYGGQSLARIRPGRRASVHNVRPRQSAMTVALMVFCFFLPETNARRPPQPAGGRRTCISVASNRSSMPSAWA